MVSGGMKANPYRPLFFFVVLILISQLPLRPAPAQEMTPQIPIIQETTGGTTQLLIILSPQYAHDPDIEKALHYYTTAVYNDLRWNSTILPITPQENEYQIIDTIIEQHDNPSNLKACLMVGEDLDTALASDTDYLEQPSVIPWATIGGPSSYEITPNGILCQPYIINICISLLYPTHALPYETKKADIITALTKFATERYASSNDGIHIFENSNLSASSKPLYTHLSCLAPCCYQEDPTNIDIQQSLAQSYSIYMVHGHSTPAGTDLSLQPYTGWFSADNLVHLQTPVFCADGCYTGGWWSDERDNNKLDPSCDATWYGSKIFTSPFIHVMVLGLLSQNGFSTPVSFIENALPKLLSGKTLAESMIGDYSIGDTIIVGDPTFHFIE
jgi:hypothetical protein